MKTIFPTKLSRGRLSPSVLVTLAILSLLLIIQSLPARAQGMVHLGPGDSYLFSNATLDYSYINEGLYQGLWVTVGWSGDLFGPGDSFQIDAFSSPPATAVLATGISTNYTAGTEFGSIQFRWNGVYWNYGTPGSIRITMLTGSADVSSIAADNYPPLQRQHFSFQVPEPGASLLVTVGLGLFGGARRLKHRKRKG